MKKIKTVLKMSNREEITHRELETYLRIKELVERNGYKDDDLRKMVRGRARLIIHSDDMEPKKTNVYQKQLKILEFLRKLSYMHYQEKRWS